MRNTTVCGESMSAQMSLVAGGAHARSDVRCQLDGVVVKNDGRICIVIVAPA